MHSVILLVLCLDMFECALAFSKSGIYIDNGIDQTALNRHIDEKEKNDMELEILNLLGLPHRPMKVNKSELKKSAPKFLLDIYKTLVENENDEVSRAKRNADLNLSGQEQEQISESDVIMTFESVNNHVRNLRHERGKRLWFDVFDAPVAEDIVGAELKIFKYPKDKDSEIHTITAYELINNDVDERELEYVSAINITADDSGWISLNVTSCLATWVAFPKSNRGFYLSVHPFNEPSHEVRPEDIGLVMAKADDEIQPFMVAFMRAQNQVKVRSRRAAKTKKDNSFTSVVNGYLHDAYRGNDDKRSCRVETLYISFKDLKWQDWIIAPNGYAAYYCTGECNFPLNANMNATNHAIVQTLVHLMNPWRFPKPCCAPTKLSTISVLHFLDDKNVVLKKYKKMVVKSCGCH